MNFIVTVYFNLGLKNEFYPGYVNYAETILFLNRVWVNAINQSIISPYALESVQYFN